MELRESDKYIGKYVIVDLTPEAEKYVEDVQVEYFPFGKIANHACMVDVPAYIGMARFVEYVDRLKELGLTFSAGAEVAYAHWRIFAAAERAYKGQSELARRMESICLHGCAACDEFEKFFIGKDEYAHCRHCGRELAGFGKIEMNYTTGMGEYRTTYVPEPTCKYFGGEK